MVALRGREAATCRPTSVPRVGLEPMIPVFEREKASHVLNSEATLVQLINILYGLSFYNAVKNVACSTSVKL